MKNGSEVPYRLATIRAASKGLSAWQLAKVCNKLRPGVDFRGCGKKQLYKDFADGYLSHVTGGELRAAISDFMRR